MDLYNNLRFKNDQPLENDLFRVAAICKWGFGAIFFNWKGVFFGNDCYIQVYETETTETKNCCLVCYICHNQVVNIQHLWQRLQSLLNIQLSSPNGQIVPNANQITSMIHEYDSRFKEFIFMQWISIKNHFLDASSYLYKRVCPSVGPLVRRFREKVEKKCLYYLGKNKCDICLI